MDVMGWTRGWIQLCLVSLGIGIGSIAVGQTAAVQAAEMYVDEVVPSEVAAGQVFTIYGQFPGMTSAAAYLSDGVYGLPLTVLSVSDQEMTARLDATPWPMTGTIHVMNQQEPQAIPHQTWQGSGVTLSVTGGLFQSTQAASGGVLTVIDAPPGPPPEVFGAFGGGLRLKPKEPCADSAVLLHIEPDLDRPLMGDEDLCKGLSVRLLVLCEDGANMPVANFYSTLAAGLHQLFSPHGLQVTFDPNSYQISSVGALAVQRLADCATLTGAGVVLEDN